MKKWLSLIVIITLILLTGCNQTKKDEITMETNEETQVTLQSDENFVYSDEQLTEIANFTGIQSELLARYPTTYIQTVSKKNAESETYDPYAERLIYRAETKVLFMVFDTSGNKMSASVHDTLLSKQAFESLSLGQTLDEVREIDPNGVYWFLYTGRNDVPKVSTHYTTDGFVVTITYDKNNVIEKMDIAPM